MDSSFRLANLSCQYNIEAFLVLSFRIRLPTLDAYCLVVASTPGVYSFACQWWNGGSVFINAVVTRKTIAPTYTHTYSKNLYQIIFLSS